MGKVNQPGEVEVIKRFISCVTYVYTLQFLVHFGVLVEENIFYLFYDNFLKIFFKIHHWGGGRET